MNARYEINGQTVFAGTVAYETDDGWVGIRQADGRIDEVRCEFVVIE